MCTNYHSHPPDTIYIRSITDNEVKPKTKAQ